MLDIKSLFKGFSKLNRNQRFQRLLEMKALTKGMLNTSKPWSS